MEMLKEILAKILEKEEIHILFSNLKINMAEVIEMECYKTLRKIKIAIEDNSLSDFECIEQIVCIFEQMGSSGGNRHDFG